MDLHLHTPGSSDFHDPNISYLDILRQAELRGLDIIAFTDHNTVAGYATMNKTVEQLSLLEQLDRIAPDEQRRLDEYRRLLHKILVLPGFEFTATFGFHILGIFPPDTSIAFLEHLLLTLNVPPELIKKGSATVGATSDVLTAYRVINEAGGIVLAAHANSGNGVAMRGFDFGGQTRIAYTQDPHLHALEVTDLEKRGRYSTRRFFDGSKPEYPRPMRCIQGSDAHRLIYDPDDPKVLGVGDRITEILLSEVSFEALKEVLEGNDFSLTRPYRGKAKPVDFVQAAREEGESIVQSFHEKMVQKGGYFNRILEDICAMANTTGGTIYIGASPNPKETPVGVHNPRQSAERLESTVTRRFSPAPEVDIDQLISQGKNIVRVTVQPGAEPPYALDDNRFYVRDDTETNMAVRDEIVRLVERGRRNQSEDETDTSATVRFTPPVPPAVGGEKKQRSQPTTPPSTGVEIVESKERSGTIYHTVQDLRNGNQIKNVTRSSARKLWHYAITQIEENPPQDQDIDWIGNIALLDKRSRDKHVWYDLAMRSDGDIRVFYGVTDSGLNEDWMALIEQAENGKR
ncbi:MAG: putative DNA binding domain-containing protein [Candidatus Promineifilaceae bacterium]|nr:putative DNA binding domain-containing protein [Candidatus Promineifilaceae bacterium]